MSTEQFKEAQYRISEASYQSNRTYAYAAGYFQSLAAEMFTYMTKKQKEEFLRQVEKDAVRLEAIAQYKV